MCSLNDNLNEELLEFIYQTPIGICETDENGKVIRLNPFMVQLIMKIIDKYDGSEIPNLIEVLNSFDGSLKTTLKSGIDKGVKLIFNNYDIALNRHGVRRIRIKCSVLNKKRLAFTVEDISVTAELEERKRQTEILEANMSTIFALAKLAESRDDDTGKHIERVQNFCRLLAESMQMLTAYSGFINEEFIENIVLSSPLHDIGKVGIPDSILQKPGRLTNDEFREMQRHSLIGAETLEAVRDKYPNNRFINMGIRIAKFHHEKWNGSGYPEGLKGEAIPIEARIMALADVYDALRSKRIYKPEKSHPETCEIILQSKGSHFDPKIIEVFKNIHHDFEKSFSSLSWTELMA